MKHWIFISSTKRFKMHDWLNDNDFVEYVQRNKVEVNDIPRTGKDYRYPRNTCSKLRTIRYCITQKNIRLLNVYWEPDDFLWS